MVADAEKFAAEDEANRKKIEALNSLSSFVYGLKNQVTDSEGLGGKLDSDDKQTILDAVKEATEWIEENGSTASVEDLEEKLAGTKRSFLMFSFHLLTSYPEVQGVVNPITTKLYEGAGADGPSGDDDFEFDHDEL